MHRVLRNAPSLVAGALLVAFFFYCTGFGLFIHLGYDDVMNTTFAWEPPLHGLLIALLSPFTSIYRPTGSALYRLMFAMFGLRSEPFRGVTYALLLGNLYLVYKLAGKLSHSKEVAAMSALLYSFHGRLAPIYLNNGTVYDVLCCTLSLLTILYYLKVREAGAYLTWRGWFVFLALFIFALNAKEMAAAIPPLLICYEVIYHRIRFIRQAAPSIVGIVIALGAAVAKMGPGSVMYGNPPYRMTVSVDQFVSNWRLLLSDLVYARGRGLTGFEASAIWISVVLIVIIMRRKRYVAFFAAIAFLGPLPIILIPFRGFFVMYFPFVGWAMLVAAVLVEGRNWLLADKFPEPGRIVLFALVAFFMVYIAKRDPESPRRATDPGQVVITEMRDDILSLNEALPRHARVLFLHDRFPPDAWGTLMITRLLYDDRSLRADRPTMMQQRPDESSYDRVFDYVNGRLAVVRRRLAPPQVLYYPR